MRISPRSPITRCQGMPFPEGVAAIARPAVRAPPGRPKALASPPYVRTFPRGIRCTSRYTGSQDISLLLLLFVVTPRCQSVSKKRNRHGRCELRQEQEKNAGTGFNGVAFGISLIDKRNQTNETQKKN